MDVLFLKISRLQHIRFYRKFKINFVSYNKNLNKYYKMFYKLNSLQYLLNHLKYQFYHEIKVLTNFFESYKEFELMVF